MNLEDALHSLESLSSPEKLKIKAQGENQARRDAKIQNLAMK
jgi:hypothetical protein